VISFNASGATLEAVAVSAAELADIPVMYRPMLGIRASAGDDMSAARSKRARIVEAEHRLLARIGSTKFSYSIFSRDSHLRDELIDDEAISRRSRTDQGIGPNVIE
jgi:hypothetical protein